MTDMFLAYNLKVAILIAVFYVFWRLLLAHETWHRLNRVILLLTAASSFVLPLCVITIHQTVEVDDQSVRDYVEMPIPTMTEEPLVMPGSPVIEDVGMSVNWQALLIILYIIGVLVVLCRMLVSVWQLHRIKSQSELHEFSGKVQIAVCDKAGTPFSWWNTIYLNQKDYEQGVTALLTHELEHVRLHHSADVLLVELLTALQWFNPTMWMLRSDLRTIHEYEADQQVLSHGFNDIQYLHLLIRKAASQGGYSLVNGIANSTLKKRIIMMMKPISSRWKWLRIAYVLPIIAVSLYASCKTETEYKVKEESAVLLIEREGKSYYSIKAPAGSFYSWLVSGKLAERGIVEEDGQWNVRTNLSTEDYIVMLDGKQIDKDDVPYIPLSSIKEIKSIQGDYPRRIELFTKNVSGFRRDQVAQWPKEYKDCVKSWMFFRVEDAATGQQLKGAEVSIEGTGQKVLTNREGWCELKVPLGSTVKVTYKGMAPQSMKIDHLNGSKVQGRTFWLSKPGEPIYFVDKLSKEQEPKFNGDKEQWLADHVQLPKTANGGGRVSVFAVINEDGSVSGVRLMQGVRKEQNEEAIRVVSAMPRWQPATKEGRPVKCLTLIGVPFK